MLHTYKNAELPSTNDRCSEASARVTLVLLLKTVARTQKGIRVYTSETYRKVVAASGKEYFSKSYLDMFCHKQTAL